MAIRDSQVTQDPLDSLDKVDLQGQPEQLGCLGQQDSQERQEPRVLLVHLGLLVAQVLQGLEETRDLMVLPVI